MSRDERMEISVSRYEKRFLQNGIKYLPVILERSEESRQKVQVLHIIFELAKTKNNEMTHTKKPSPLVGEGVNR